ncbi:hypothetical protein [Klebsiella aerogenes]|uniref:Uncharacterized protein n=1 Tax=Klebsiella aerogenes TaxID=548 RepID=A0AAP9U808_KLEAE|nr:hypothetical protein [Klebsiella aerogenes]QMR42830.1 hypothetical protein HV331_25205 [Klebsiella aerogenes]
MDVGGSQLIGRAECTEKKAVNAHRITGTQTLVEAGHYTAQFVVAAESCSDVMDALPKVVSAILLLTALIRE